MVVEIVWFLVLPVWNEFKAWYKLRNQLTVNMHLKRTIAILIIIAGILIFPGRAASKEMPLSGQPFIRIFSLRHLARSLM